MLIGYLRPGMADSQQVLACQGDALFAAGVTPARLREDHALGKHDDWPGLAACLEGPRQLVRRVDDLAERRVGLRVLAGAGRPIDTTASNDQAMPGVFAALVEFGRRLASARGAAGLAAARAHGHPGGRPCKMTPAKLRLAQEGMSRRGIAVGALCAELGITRQTLYRHLDPEGRLRRDVEKLLCRCSSELTGRLPTGQQHA
ncbi:helix-turn-helix domain-containing protein [Belnapia sp. F-4-1]|uniref:helix-turn-helix domain-containing protein n=1 Tax=Belnapia sp. F-4-1 TaxID=1545443 RepID=UPI00068B9F8F|nr:helix-turn-helix domain-containing protein [Belnapia sp. F-4-1]